ncbi:putative wall-associated receptor kinase-like 16 [Cornus florida]|uniref:putative wall-associated receptor kinase-like 16 n=1 Tax=Cornus florida TaxID=4283 RepID=UPI0028976763|nr:putative wall-associated receptor kinase-like 16 [Cornus florida]
MGCAILLVQLTLIGAILAATPTTAATQPNPGCATTCGDLNIPFPFGTSSDCYLDPSFLITCNETHFNPPRPFLRLGTIQVLNISLDGLMLVSSNVAQDCYNQSGLVERRPASLKLSSFFISNTLNKFTAIGCDTVAVVLGTLGENYTTGCLSLCDHLGSVVNQSCSGVGCCQTAIPQAARDFSVGIASLNNHSLVQDFNPCGYAFVVEEAAFSFSSLDLKDLQKRETVPVVLDWAVGNETCEEAMKNSSSYACQALHSQCLNSTNGPGYRCSCTSGYEGNPYLIDGCQGISIGLLAIVVGSSWIYWILRKRKLIKLREKFFQQNGGIMLQQQLSKHEGSVETARIFTAEDLKKATNNYDESRIVGQGGFGTVYKGVLSDDRIVAIKKSKISDQTQIEQFINELVVLSQINHRNVVKLLGCCLETEVPLLVYEFITNGTLSDHIHNEDRASLLSWEIRLKIAAEATGALSYLHSATSPAIIHRDIKCTNILLDNTYAAKVSDFGASRLVPHDHTQLTTLVQGTFGYLDPEYFHSSQLTEKSDVYSFGVVLAELLTGEKAISFDRSENNRNLAMYFVSSMKEDQLFQILDTRMVNEGTVGQLNEVAKLARKCLRIVGEERPTMKEVAMELEGIIRMMDRHPWIEVDLYPEETEQLLNQSLPLDGYKDRVASHNGCSTSKTTGYDSMRDQIIVPLDDGR